MSTPTVDEFAQRLKEMNYRKIYLSHYEDESETRRLAKVLESHGMEVTVAADARRLGKDFVSKCIADSDLTLVLNPMPDAEKMIFHAGKITYSLVW